MTTKRRPSFLFDRASPQISTGAGAIITDSHSLPMLLAACYITNDSIEAARAIDARRT